MMKMSCIDRVAAAIGAALVAFHAPLVAAQNTVVNKEQPAKERKEPMGIRIGAEAPAFSLQDASGKETALKDFAGQWVVLYFYPKDDTPGCTTEACEFTASIADFAKLGAKVVGVSPDSPESHRKFIEKHHLAVTLLSDPGHAVMERYGAWGKKIVKGEEKEGVIRRSVIIDPKGSVAFGWTAVTAKGHADEVKAKLEELQAKK